MVKGQFCFLKDQYYIDFNDKHLMQNKEFSNGNSHNRPCFFTFSDSENPNIFWLIPISSKIEKYRTLYANKVSKYGYCNTLYFGTVLNQDAVFLIQNLCPVTQKYIQEIYVDKFNHPIQIDNRIATAVIKNTSQVLAKERRGAKIVFPDINSIYQSLLKQLDSEQNSD